MCSLLKEAEYFIDLDDVDPVHVFALLLASISPDGWLNSYVVNNGDESVIELLFGDDCYLQTFGVLDCMSMSIAITTRLQRNVTKTKHAEHRQLFESTAKYHSVIDFQDDPVLRKIHITFRMIYFRVVQRDANHD